MNPQPNQYLEPSPQKLEAEIDQTPPPPPLIPRPKQPLQQQTNNSQSIQSILNRFINWFNGLPGFGKLLFIGVATVVGFAILREVFKLVAAVISLAVLGVLLYFVYQFFLARSSETKD